MTRAKPVILLVTLATLNAAVWAVALSAAGFVPPARHLIAEYLSTTALIIMCTNLMLSTRLRPFERFYLGLDKLFVSHRLNGLTAATVIFAHFLLMPETPGWPLSKIIGYPTITFVVISVLLAISPRSPWRKFVTLRYHNWKLEHRFMGLFVTAGVLHSLVGHAVMLSLPPLRAWVYTFAALGLAAYAYRELAERFVVERHGYRVGKPCHVIGDVLEIPLEPVTGPIEHRSGQFAFVRFEGGPSLEQHPFTISRAPAGGALRFSVKGSGDWTSALQQHLDAGSPARIEGPYGYFDYRRGKPRQLWLAGGIGITPYLAFLGDMSDEFDVSLVWTVRHEAQAFYRDEIEAAVAAHPRVSFTVHATNVSGHLKADSLDLGDLQQLSVFICGPVPMRDSFIEQLVALGMRRGNIFYEEFSLR